MAYEYPTWESADRDLPSCRLTRRFVVSTVAVGDRDVVGREKARVCEVFGDEVVQDTEHIGAPAIHRGSVGRGGEVSTVLLEWVVEPAGKGVVSLVAAEAFKRLMRRLREVGARPGPLISAGMAGALAVAEIGDVGHHLVLEGVFEPAEFRESAPTELNYVGIEPWIVVLAVPGARCRNLVVVGPEGEIVNVTRIPMSETEVHYFPPH